MLRKPVYGRIFFEADTGDAGGNSGAAGTASTTGTPPGTGESDAVAFTEAQQKEINRLIGKARTEGRTAAEQAATDAETARQAEATRLADIAKGDFDKVKTDLEGERDGFKAERDTLQTERDALADYFDGQFTAALKDLPEAIVAFAPAEDASFADKSAWLVKAQEQAAKIGGSTKPGNGPNPKPGEGKIEAVSLISRHAI